MQRSAFLPAPARHRESLNGHACNQAGAMQRVREEVAKDGDKQANKEVVEEVDKKVVEELETHRHCPATFSQTRILGLLVGILERV